MRCRSFRKRTGTLGSPRLHGRAGNPWFATSQYCIQGRTAGRSPRNDPARGGNRCCCYDSPDCCCSGWHNAGCSLNCSSYRLGRIPEQQIVYNLRPGAFHTVTAAFRHLPLFNKKIETPGGYNPLGPHKGRSFALPSGRKNGRK